MPATAADIGYGATFLIKNGGGTYDAVAEVSAITPPGRSRDAIDATHLTSPDRYKEFIAGMKEGGDASFTFNYVPAASDALVAAFEAGKGDFRVGFPSGTVALDFGGIPTSWEPGEMSTDKMTGTMTIKSTGKAVLTALGAPENLILPAIIGVAQEGEELALYLGHWEGATSFTYQWENGGSNISGATAATYRPVTGDVGDAITCTVTGVNTAGSASATTAATANVIAA